MKAAALPENEQQRLERLRAYGILDTEAESTFDELARLASQLCDAPVALISFVDEDRQWFKSAVGVDARETPREHAFCAHAILQHDVFTVKDASRDDRFRDNPLVTSGPRVRAYAGAPLISAQGEALGTVCVIDQNPREFSESQKSCLATIAKQAMVHMELRRLRQGSVHSYGHAAGVLAAIAHELRTPLNSVVGATEMLLDSGLNEEQRRWAELAQKSSQALLTAVEQVLALGQEMVKSGLVQDTAKISKKP